MLKFYKDKTQTFECLVEIEGASLSKATPRLIFTPTKDEKRIFFEGKIKDDGTCTVDVSPGPMIGKEGNIILEIIVDDTTIFQPWDSDYEIITEQAKIAAPTVTIKENRNIPKITVKNIKEEKPIPKFILKEVTDKHFKTKILESDYQKVTGFMSAVKQLDKTKKSQLMESLEKFKPKKSTLTWSNNIFKDSKSTMAKISMFLKEKSK